MRSSALNVATFTAVVLCFGEVAANSISTNCEEQRQEFQTNSFPADREVTWCTSGFLGELPSSFFGAPSLRIVNYPNGQVNSTDLDGFANLKTLISLTIKGRGDVKLSGTIPASWGTALENIEELDLSNNELSGSLPSELGLLSNLRELNLRNNNLDSNLPLEVFLLPKLERLYLDNNQFTGDIPNVFGAKKLEDLGFSQNNLTGCVPAEMIPLGFRPSEQRGGTVLEVCTPFPTLQPTSSPSNSPTSTGATPDPTGSPSMKPTTAFPTYSPTLAPTSTLEDLEDDIVTIAGLAGGTGVIFILSATYFILRRRKYATTEHFESAHPEEKSEKRSRAESASKKGMTYHPGEGWVENKSVGSKHAALPPPTK